MTLGLVVIWASYTLGIYGFSKIRGARGGPQLTISDCVLPSHRHTFMVAAVTWSTAPINTSGAPGPTVGSVGPGLPPTNIVPGGLKGQTGSAKATPNKPINLGP